MTLAPLAEAPIARWVGMLAPARQLAEVLAMTEFVPTALRGKPDAIAAAILYGDELGVSPMQALASIHVVEGKPQPSSELMRALILGAGHSLAVHEMTGTRVRVSGLRQGRPEGERVTVEWTMDQARAAGLANRPNWRSYPRAMLLARAFGDLARTLFPDAVKGLSWVAEDDATASDLEAWGTTADVVGDQDVAPPEKARKALQRARRPKAAPEADEAPVAPPASPPPGSAPQAVGYDPDDQPLPPELAPEVVMAPVVPEDLKPEAVPRPDPIGPGPVRVLNTLLSAVLGTSAPRKERLNMLSGILGREVLSSKEVTSAEGLKCRDALDLILKGDLKFDMDPSTGDIAFPDGAVDAALGKLADERAKVQ